MAGVVDWFKFLMFHRRKRLRGPDSVNCREAVKIMSDSAESLLRLINSILPSDKTPRLPKP